MAQFSTVVHASLDKVWNNLLLKIDTPEKFVPGVSGVEIIEKNDAYVIRKMTVITDGKATILTEKITFVPYIVRFQLVEHPTFEGYVTNDLTFISDDRTEMTFDINWIDKITQSEVASQEIVQNAVLKTKSFIENT